jgi:hypothetical protein
MVSTLSFEVKQAISQKKGYWCKAISPNSSAPSERKLVKIIL